MRNGDWIQTFTGIQFWPLEAMVSEIDIVDIAHSLSMQCRFGGHCEEFYTVAEHSCLISDYVSQENKLWGLLHDATEAYLIDLPRPIKRSIPEYKTIENRLMKVICERYALPEEMPAEVHDADGGILMTESKQNMKPAAVAWVATADAIDIKLNFWSPKRAEKEFLNRFAKLYKGK